MEIKFDNWFLYFSAITANSFFISSGCMLVWNSPVLPKLQSNDTSVNPLGAPITLLELSIITSINPIGSIIGTLIIGKIPDIIGRKKTLVFIALGAFLSFVGLFFSNHIYLFFTFLLLVAIHASAASILIPMYTVEIAENYNRGKLGYLISIETVFGQLYAYVLGAVTGVNLFCLLCGVPLFLIFIFAAFLPESPIYLSSKGDKVGAILVLRKLRQTKNVCDIEAEYNERQHFLQNRNSTEKMKFRSFFVNRAARKGLILSTGARMIQQLAGISLILSFLSPLLSDAQSSLSGDILAIIVAAIKMLTALVAISIVEKIGRRILILLACCSCGISMFILGFYFYFKDNNFPLSNTVRLIPLFAIISFVVGYTLGLSSLPFVLGAELLPNELRSVGSSVAQSAANICWITISVGYPVVSKYLGVHYCMFTFGLFCFIGFIFMFLLLPETKGKSFTEIKDILNR